MIDWISLSFNAVWLIGLALLLATAGMLDWLAARRSSALRQALDDSLPAKLGLVVGVALIGLGVGALSDQWWQSALWGILFILAIRDGWVSWRDSRHKGG